MKKVIRKLEEPEVVSLDCIRVNKIYAIYRIGGIYKLQGIAPNWMFCAMHDSRCGASGAHDTIKSAMNAEIGGDIYEFDNTIEFLDWAKKQLT